MIRGVTSSHTVVATQEVTCPEVDAQCPDVLAASMFYQTINAPRVAMAGS
jgi:hypothetical protein